MSTQERIGYRATFHPQAWVNDNAIPVDPEGETSWDATEFVERVLRDGLPVGLDSAQAWLDGTLEHGDYHDILRTDPNAPQWVQDWSGPFDTHLEAVKKDLYAEYLRQHGHRCPYGTIDALPMLDLGRGIRAQIGICGCGEVIARRYTITGPGTGPWTVLQEGRMDGGHI